MSTPKAQKFEIWCLTKLFTVICVFIFFHLALIRNAESYSIEVVTEFTTIDSSHSQDDPVAVTDDVQGPLADELPSFSDITTEFVNDQENEIERRKREVVDIITESHPMADEAATTVIPFASIDSEPLPSTPFPRPDADYNYPTVNPIPEGFDPSNLTDIDLSTGFIQNKNSRASCQCGKPSGRIVGGSVASIKQYPWMVGLTRGGGRPYCGGTLINSRYVVTASHCVYGQTASRITVVLNEQDFSSGSDGAKPVTVRVESIKMHENYNSNNIDNDIALLRLAQAIPLGNPYIPVCLPSANTNDFAGIQATVTGWGATSQGGATSSTLRHVTVPVISNQECNSSPKSKYQGKITANMMCAGLLSSGGKDSCQGDSGGPLIIDNGGRKTLIGIVSWGYGCAQPGSPGVYARVAKFPDWILANTRGADWCQG